MPHALEQCKANPNEWNTSMLKAPCNDPAYCCFSCFCAPCVTYMHRNEIIADGPYICCLGMCPCCTMELPKIPCLCCEICCCIGLAASANRIHVMNAFSIKPDPCDEYIICCSNIMQCLAICARIFCDPEIADVMENIADILFCIVLSCMQTQTNYEIKNNPRAHGEWPKFQGAMR
uniref:Uncharacterized protein n=1 Tax=Lotharella globosa TaxID=91324 RepID=A0A7S3YMK0_9EUKA|mmetsp:Transcript_2448/g.4783  ORF Transcript_2448/g.4783 Transcript_2448/m.4783 type:complete len:176 (-) Transcript_2448:233-760(-)